MSTVNQSSPLSELLDKYVQKQPYILEDARESYRHWWENETHWLWYSYKWQTHEPTAKELIHRLYPHLEEFKTKRKLYHYTRRNYKAPWRLSTSGESSFRQNGYAKKERKDSFNREEKTRDYRKNDKTPTRWPVGGKRRHYCQIQDNRSERRLVKAQLNKGDYDKVKDWSDPIDTWSWD